MASPSPSSSLSTTASFKLDRSIFNETLYSRLRDFWFAHLPENAVEADEHSNKRWYGGLGPDGKVAFDGECSSNFGRALEAVAPEKYPLPAWESYERDIADAAAISGPFLEEVKVAQQREGDTKGADTLLSLLLLFDQMPRNIHRDQAGLRLVYGHYDRLAFALVRASLHLQPNPLQAESYLLRPVRAQWLILPLMHCEHLPSHELYADIAGGWKQHALAGGSQPAIKQVERNLDFEAKHLEPLRLFGRYPHRNQALGRESSREEEEYLRTGETFGVGQEAKGGKDEL